jgi:hypothetical protein
VPSQVIHPEVEIAAAARTMFASLARLVGELGEAFAVARDAFDMGNLPNEIVAEVVLGRSSLADALAAAADVLEDSTADVVEDLEPEDLEPEEREQFQADQDGICARFRAASRTLSSLKVSP